MNDAIRVLMVNYEWPGITTNCGGGGRIGARLAVQLRERGHDIDVFSDDRDGHYSTFPFRTAWRLRRTLQAGDYDVVHGQFAVPSSLFLPRLCRTTDTPLVVSLMGADVYDPSRYRTVRPVLNRIAGRISRRADAVTAPSTDLQHRAHERFGVQPRVIPYGIDAGDWPPPTPLSTPPTVLTVCRLVERKNLFTAYQAITEARGQGYPLEWTVVGTGPAKSWLDHQAEQHDWLTVEGYVKDIKRQYREADVFFLPSQYESFGIVFLEALASGLPVIASDHGGQTDIVKNGVGELAPPDNPGQLASKLIAVASSYDTYHTAAQEYVATNFSAGQMANDFETVFLEVI